MTEKKCAFNVHYSTVISIPFHFTGPCSCRVRGVDGSCAKHFTVESYMDIYASNSYTYYY